MRAWHGLIILGLAVCGSVAQAAPQVGGGEAASGNSATARHPIRTCRCRLRRASSAFLCDLRSNSGIGASFCRWRRTHDRRLVSDDLAGLPHHASSREHRDAEHQST